MSTERISISLPREMVQLLDALAKRMALTRSGAVQKLLEKKRQEDLEALMAAGYQEMAAENRHEAEKAVAAQAEVALHGM